MKKKTNNVVRRIRIQIETLTERHKQKQITLLEFIHGLSIIIAQKSATALWFSNSNSSFSNLYLSYHTYFFYSISFLDSYKILSFT